MSFINDELNSTESNSQMASPLRQQPPYDSDLMKQRYDRYTQEFGFQYYNTSSDSESESSDDGQSLEDFIKVSQNMIDDEDDSGDENVNAGPKEQIGNQALTNKTTSFLCNFCDKKFKNRNNLRTHQKRQHPETEWNLTEIKSEFSPIVKHQEIQKGPVIVCDICNKQISRGNFRRHVKTLHPHMNVEEVRSKSEVSKIIQKFTCPFPNCPKIFGLRSSLIRHQKVHEVRDKFTCEVCPGRFSEAGRLVLHYTRKHPHFAISEELKAKRSKTRCLVCGRVFGYKNLKKHEKSHTDGSAKFQCDLCPFLYSEFTSLRNHYKSQHSVDSDNSKCQICHRVFDNTENLRAHIEAHSDADSMFECEVCHKAYESENHLTEHTTKFHRVEQLSAAEYSAPSRINNGVLSENFSCVKQENMEIHQNPVQYFSCDQLLSHSKKVDGLELAEIDFLNM